jgi:hypothetical protein
MKAVIVRLFEPKAGLLKIIQFPALHSAGKCCTTAAHFE